MPLEKKPNKLESKKSFYKTIENHYKPIVDDKIPKSILSDLCLYLAHSLHKSYKILRKKHPKSKDRFSKFNTVDLHYPFTQYGITNFLKGKDAVNYTTYCKILFKMNDEELAKYLKEKHTYETK
ncbi:hypothetical protein [Cellulophaga omnivescoria]|uniref:hypothetical protein n=1 Tax=Cellulophaga omnivescoria TaxID=1888890 RepID=UPI0009847005|nr:hypothetical protein [Cellulophaga omnivescoria]WBU90774.1 hypothetical protein PBN93_07085 [Cellulophaga omnivescoria]WKB82906.1 hypothetical protein QYR09_07665 [Cellulophaga lytica]